MGDEAPAARTLVLHDAPATWTEWWDDLRRHREVLVANLVPLVLAVALVNIALRLSRAPRAVVVITAAVVIHISWRRMMERTGALTLVPFDLPRYSGSAVFVGLAVILSLVLALDHFGRHPSPDEKQPML